MNKLFKLKNCGKMDNFVNEPLTLKWEAVFAEYSTVLKLKAEKFKPDKKKSLLQLDNWYQNELPTLIADRKNKHLTHEELCQLMKWKLTKGKFRPRLTEMVQTNPPELVVEASTKAFQSLPDTASAVQALTVLKAVGPATASAILAAGAPKHVAFMADESMQVLPGLQPLKYDLSQFKNYTKSINSLVKQLNKQDPDKSWTAHKVELTLWTYQMAKVLKPDILESIEKSDCNSNKELAEPPRKKAKV